METPHTFAGNPLDRGEALRRDEENIATLRNEPTTRFLAFHKLNVAAAEDGQLNWIEGGHLDTNDVEGAILLGEHEGRALFATTIEDAERFNFTDCRQMASVLPTAETGILAQARAQLDWHHRNPFCAQCGNPTRPERGGQIRRCTNCEKHIFPRTDPVAIMLIVDEPGGERCLLGKSQGRMARSNFYSALAGFLDQGESLEEAVRREVWEEAGIRVGPVQYHSSQPWPFPSQLMIGCHGVALTQDISIDEVEMADVSWFTRDEVKASLDENNPDLRVPGAMAIAHHLIKSWVEGEVSI